jgi:hypothetical protein
VAHLLSGLAGTCGGVLKVGDHPAFVDEAYMLGRAVVERSVNVSYLSICDAHAYDGLLQHAQQRAYRDTERSAGIGDMRYTIRNQSRPKDLSDYPELELSLARFTSRKNRPKNWTDLTLDERINAIGRAVPHASANIFVIAELAIYSKASEALHGSLAGVLQFGDPEFSFDDARRDYTWEKRTEELTTLFLMLARVMESLLRVLAHATESAAVQELSCDADAEVAAFFKHNGAPSAVPEKTD